MLPQPAKDKFYVLLADNSEDERSVLKAAIHHFSCLQIVAEVDTGIDVVAYLNGTGQFADRQNFPLPDLLLLDLMMPSQSGFEVLAWLQTQAFDNLTVVALTDSMLPEHFEQAMKLGADRFYVKGWAHHRQAMLRELVELLQKKFSPGTDSST